MIQERFLPTFEGGLFFYFMIYFVSPMIIIIPLSVMGFDYDYHIASYVVCRCVFLYVYLPISEYIDRGFFIERGTPQTGNIGEFILILIAISMKRFISFIMG